MARHAARSSGLVPAPEQILPVGRVRVPLRIVFTVPWGARLGGAEGMLWTFLKNVDRSRIEPIVIFLQPGSFESEVRALGFRTAILDAGRLRHVWKGARVIRSLVALMRRERPDLVVNWLGKSHYYGGPAGVIAGLGDRILWWQHGIPRDRLRFVNFIPARAIGCSSQACALAQGRAWPKRRTFVVHPGIDPPARAGRIELEALRRQLDLVNDAATVVGIVGRLQPWKGQHRFIEAISQLRLKGHNIYGLVVGGNAHNLAPGYEDYLRQLVSSLGVSNIVRFTGHVSNAAPYVQLMDVLVNASIDEPFGIAVSEGMALGVPVVAVGSGGPAEILEPDRSGLLVSRPSVDEFVPAIERLLTDPALRQELARRASDRFKERFTASRMTEQLESVLETLATPATDLGIEAGIAA